MTAVFRGRISRIASMVAGVVAASGLLVCPSVAAAQDTRREQIAEAQEEKAKDLHPYQESRAEKILEGVENVLGQTATGVYPWVGSIMGGGWLAFGAGYAQPFGDTGRYNLQAGWSLRNYKLAQVNVKLPEFARRTMWVNVDARWMDAPRVSFYGLGIDSRQDDKTSFDFQPTRIDARLTVQPVHWFSFGGGAGYLDVNTDRGSLDPSIDDLFTPVTAPGLGADVSYAATGAFAAIDWRESPGYTRSGGLYRVDWTNYSDTDDGPYGFRQLDVDVRQFLPLLRENWVLAFRGLVTLTDVDEGDQVPYFLMPYLGSGETLRGYANRRFRDRNMMLLQGEYRWTPSHFMDMAIFVDAGKVAARRGDLDLDGLKTDWGVGARFHGPNFTALRLEVARGDEGWSLVFATGVF